jgi:hypothetical protein
MPVADSYLGYDDRKEGAIVSKAAKSGTRWLNEGGAVAALARGHSAGWISETAFQFLGTWKSGRRAREQKMGIYKTPDWT